MLAIPLVMIFAVLFASADPIFRRGMDDLLGLPHRPRRPAGSRPVRRRHRLAGRRAAGGRGSRASRRSRSPRSAPPRRRPPIGVARSLGTTEALVVLVAVDLIVGLFVGLQVAYLFGGLDTLAAAGMTYSAYARRGYFELVAAAALAGGLLVFLEYQVIARTRPYVVLAIGLVALTLVVLASAVLRLQLYQDAYGWTELRLYVAVSIVAMAATLVTMALFLATDRTRWLGHAMAVIGRRWRSSGSTSSRRRRSSPSATRSGSSTRASCRPTARRRSTPTTSRSCPTTPSRCSSAALPRLPPADAERLRAMLLDAQGGARDATRRYASPFAWNLGRERAEDGAGDARR